MRTYKDLPGAVKLPDGYFWRVEENIINNIEVQIRKQRFIGSRRVGHTIVINRRLGVSQLEKAVRRAYEDFLDKTTVMFSDYLGNFQ
jgi:hypothetical protein